MNSSTGLPTQLQLGLLSPLYLRRLFERMGATYIKLGQVSFRANSKPVMENKSMFCFSLALILLVVSFPYLDYSIVFGGPMANFTKYYYWFFWIGWFPADASFYLVTSSS